MREAVLSVGEWAYRMGLRTVRFGFSRRVLRVHRLPAYVVSVGNLTWGGTGKTPLVLCLARLFEGKGRRVAVLTRGYGKDEVELMSRRLAPIPVLVGADRVKTGLQAVREYGADLLLLDDGYQQWRLFKNLEILAADAAFPFGNGHLIPRGTLREPMEAAGRADLIVLKKGSSGETGEGERLLRRLNPRAPIFRMDYRPTGLWSWPSGRAGSPPSLRGQKVCTLAGLADPAHFEALVASLGARAALRYRVRDHHAYTTGELIRLLSRCRRHGIRTIVTTAKDAVRIPALLLKAVGPDLKGAQLLVLEVAPEFEPDESELHHRIDSLLAR